MLVLEGILSLPNGRLYYLSDVDEPARLVEE